MRFLNRSKKKFQRTLLIISDLHLGAGAYIEGKKNPLEDFHSDEELVEFLKFYSENDYLNHEVELIINGDFLDFLAVPYVEYFDDEFWSQEAAIKKLELIHKAHTEVFVALNNFLKTKKKTLTYLIGNHDAELVLDGVREKFFSFFDENISEKITLTKELELYQPVKGVFIKHGHQYETAHRFDPYNSVVRDNGGRPYLMPSWGSNYVINVINKYKQERIYVNQVRPIKNFLIHGMIFDTFFTIRFMLATAYYFLMVRFRFYFLAKRSISEITKGIVEELTLFEDYEELTKEFFQNQKDSKVLIVGHTHHPTHRTYEDGSIFINTGTWTKMTSLDFSNFSSGFKLTYAKVEILNDKKSLEDFDKNIDIGLFEWSGSSQLPYIEFN